MEIRFALALPSDELSVLVARRLATLAMDTMGVESGCCHDIEVALAEACTNVLDHVTAGDDYQVTVGIDDSVCVIEVIDAGRGFDSDHLGRLDAESTAEQGRGIQLMRALVDRIRFSSHNERGTVVHLEKDIVWREDAPIRQLGGAVSS